MMRVTEKKQQHMYHMMQAKQKALLIYSAWQKCWKKKKQLLYVDYSEHIANKKVKG